MRLFFAVIVGALASVLALSGCKPAAERRDAEATGGTLKPVRIVIDWQPSAEYYGFFFARADGRYRAAGFDVTIVYGSGAPAVAVEVGSGKEALGTTTSDNLLRAMKRGGTFSSARPLLAFNPSSVISLARTGISGIGELRGRTLGTNPASSVYAQFLSAAKAKDIASLGVREDPTIGFSGVEQLVAGRVDAILGYTTNVAIDAKRRLGALTDDDAAARGVRELALGDLGVRSYGVVFVAAGPDALRRSGLSDDDVRRLQDVTTDAYKDGALPANRDKVVAALRARDADPQLDAAKLALAIERIGTLNARIRYPLGSIDEWTESREISRADREAALKLYR